MRDRPTDRQTDRPTDREISGRGGGGGGGGGLTGVNARETTVKFVAALIHLVR